MEKTPTFSHENDRPLTELPIHPLLPEDMLTIHQMSRGFFHNSSRFDHQGSWKTCSDCMADAAFAALALSRRVNKVGTSREEKMAWVAEKRIHLTSVLKDGREKERTGRGVDASPDAASKAKGIEAELLAGIGSGLLDATIEEATLLLRYALAYLSDPGERPELGYVIPVGRIAASMCEELGSEITPGEVAMIWSQIECLDAPKLKEKIAQQGSQHLCGHVPEVHGGDREATSLVELVSDDLLPEADASPYAGMADELRASAVEIVLAEAARRGISPEKLSRRRIGSAVRKAFVQVVGADAASRLDGINLGVMSELQDVVDAVRAEVGLLSRSRVDENLEVQKAG